MTFVAGFNTKPSFAKRDIKLISTLFVSVIFLLALLGFFFIDFFKAEFIGVKGKELGFSLFFLIAIAVTSIPVISKIYFDIRLIRNAFCKCCFDEFDLAIFIFMDLFKHYNQSKLKREFRS